MTTKTKTKMTTVENRHRVALLVVVVVVVAAAAVSEDGFCPDGDAVAAFSFGAQQMRRLLPPQGVLPLQQTLRGVEEEGVLPGQRQQAPSRVVWRQAMLWTEGSLQQEARGKDCCCQGFQMSGLS